MQRLLYWGNASRMKANAPSSPGAIFSKTILPVFSETSARDSPLRNIMKGSSSIGHGVPCTQSISPIRRSTSTSAGSSIIFPAIVSRRGSNSLATVGVDVKTVVGDSFVQAATITRIVSVANM